MENQELVELKKELSDLRKSHEETRSRLENIHVEIERVVRSGELERVFKEAIQKYIR